MAEEIARLGYRVDTRPLAKGEKALDRLATSGKRAETSAGGVGRSIGAVGIQVQQLAGQIQGGQSPFLALSQQAADIGIVLGAPMLGVLTAFGATFAGMLVPSLFDASDATEDFNQAQANLKSTLDSSSISALGLTDQMIELYHADSALARLKVIGAIQDADDAMKATSDSMKSGIGSTLEAITSMNAALSANVSVLPQNQAAYDAFIKNTNQSLNDHANTLGISRGALINLASSYDLFVKDGSMTGLRDNLLALSESSENLTPEFRKLVSQFAIAATNGELAKSQLEQLNDVLSNGIAESSSRAIDYTKSLSETLVTLQVRYKSGELAASIFAAQQRAGVDANSEQGKSIKSLVTDIYNLNKQIDERTRKEKELKAVISPITDDQYQMASAYMAYGQALSDSQKSTSKLKDSNDDITNSFDTMSDSISNMASSLSTLNGIGQTLSGTLSAISGVASAAAAYSTGRMADMVSGAVSAFNSLDQMLGGGDFEDIAASVQANQNINMWGEKSAAIAEATGITASATKKLVGINTDMLDALTNLTSAINSAAGIITTRGNSASVNTGSLGIMSNAFGVSDSILNTALMDTAGAFIGYAVAGPLGSIVGSFLGETLNLVGKFFGGSSKVTDSGIKIIGDTLSNLIDETMVQAYQTVSYKTWRWGSTKTKTAFADAGDSVSNQFALVFGSLADSVYSAGEALGFSSEYLTDAIQNFVVDTATISLKGLSTDEQVAELEAYFSGVFNSLAVAVIPWIEEFQQTGEELGTTLTRVATEVSVLNYAIDNLGAIASDTSAYGLAQAADAISELLGGVDEFSSLMSSFIDSFASDSQKLDIYTSAMTSALGDVGLSLPDSAQGFYDLMSGIDASTAAGQQQIATILSLTDAASAYYDLLDSANDEYKSAIESAYDTLMNSTSAQTKLQYDQAQAILTTQLAMAKMTGSIPDLDNISNALNTISGISADAYSTAADYAYAQAVAANTLEDLYALTGDNLTDSQQQIALLEQIAMNTGGESSTLTIDTQSLESELTTLRTQMVSLQQQLNTQTSSLVSDVRRIRLNAEGDLIQ